MRVVVQVIGAVAALAILAGCAKPRPSQNRAATVAKIADNLIYTVGEYRPAACPNGAATVFVARLDDREIDVPLPQFKSAVVEIDLQDVNKTLISALVGGEKEGLAGCPGDPYAASAVAVRARDRALPPELSLNLWGLKTGGDSIQKRRSAARVAAQSGKCVALGQGLQSCPFVETYTRKKQTLQRDVNYISRVDARDGYHVRCQVDRKNCTIFLATKSGGALQISYEPAKLPHAEAFTQFKPALRDADWYFANSRL